MVAILRNWQLIFMLQLNFLTHKDFHFIVFKVFFVVVIVQMALDLILLSLSFSLCMDEMRKKKLVIWSCYMRISKHIHSPNKPQNVVMFFMCAKGRTPAEWEKRHQIIFLSSTIRQRSLWVGNQLVCQKRFLYTLLKCTCKENMISN